MKQGFTLVELLIVFAIFAILFLIVGSISYNTLPKSQLLAESAVVTQTLRKAQARSVSQRSDSQWGVNITSSTVTLFAGSSYASRDTAQDEQHQCPNGISASGLSEVVFQTITGETSNTGIITLTTQATGESESITVSETGLIDPQ
jgi:prepilin-type N-terminal cleavage/methylation domain-containing protein